MEKISSRWRAPPATLRPGWSAAALVVGALLGALVGCTDAAPTADGGQSDAGAHATDSGAVAVDGAAPDVGSDAADAAPDWAVQAWTESSPFVPGGTTDCAPPPAPAQDPLAQLLGAIGLDRNVGIQRTLLAKFGGAIASDPARLPFFHTLQEDMDGLGGCWSRNLAAAADWSVATDHPCTALLATLAWGLGLEVEVGGAFVAPDATAPLVEVLAQIHGIYGADFDQAAAELQAKEVPLPVQMVTARLLLAGLEAAGLRDQWLEQVGNPTRHKSWFDKGAGLLMPTGKGGIDPDVPKDAAIFLLQSGYVKLVRGALRVMQACDEGQLQTAAQSGAFSASFSTPLGRVVLRGGGDDVWDPKAADLAGDLLLALDTGGNDTWKIRAGANTSVNNPVAVAVDLGGDDTYTYEPPGTYQAFDGLMPPDEDSRTVAEPGYAPMSLSVQSRQGAGRLGIGVLLDLGGGKDHYRALRMAQGFANFGVGVQWDDGGNDSYEGESGVQASAVVGLALQYDGGGNDVRTAIHGSQAFAWTASGALLYDRAGDDDYACLVDKPLVYPSPQTPGTANASLCQGAAFGMRRDQTETHRSGGLAVLRDKQGSDTYLGSTFVQGIGYWFGIGVLADGGGDDQYDGLFYAQGAAAHFALAFFLEASGHDLYNLILTPINAVLGLGHDFSSSLFVEGGGDDIYRGSSRSLGAAKCHGYGLMVERGGNDHYTALDDKAIGWATDYDWAPGSCGNYTTVASWGFFVDQGGKDNYQKPGKALPLAGEYGDGMLWVTDDPDEKKGKEQSGGIDTEGQDCGIGLAL